MKKWLVLCFMLFTALGLISCGDTEITITFDTMGGDTIEDLVVNQNSTSINLPDPVKEGFTFDGWFLDEDYTEPFTIAALLNQTAFTVYAKWIEVVVNYTITFESNGGSAVAPITGVAGTVVTEPAPPTKEGYTFGGWQSNEALTSPYTFTTMPAENITLYAKWNFVVVSATMAFQTNGGSAIEPITQAIGTVVLAPLAPTKAGYTFGGWFSDQALTQSYAFTTMPNTNITLYAKWDIVTYTMTFESNGGSAVLPIERNVEQSSIIEPEDPIKEGYTFDGWYRENTLTTLYAFDVPINQNVTLYAKWTANLYTITFDAKGGSDVDPLTESYLETITAPEAPIKEGYTFDGWYTEETYDTLFVFDTMPLNGKTLYAKWTINIYTITFDTMGGNVISDMTLNFGEAITLPASPTKEGSTFVDWYINQDLTTLFELENMPAENITLYAKWEVIPYEITYKIDSDMYVTQTYGLGDTIVLPEPPHQEGYMFNGWFTDLNLETAFELTTMPAHDMILYAKMTVNAYTLSFETNGGNVIPAEDYLYQTELHITHIPIKEGYIFMGWFMDSALTEPYVDIDMPAEDFMIYAKWAIDEGYDYISSIIQTEKPNVKVKGIVYYTFPSPMNPGFYLYDGTGYIFVLSNAVVDIGDTIEFEAEFSFFEYIPQLTNVTNLLENTSFDTMPTPTPMTIAEIYALDPEDPTYYGKPIIITGGLEQHGMDYYMVDMTMNDPLFINYKSLMGLMPNPLEALIGGFVAMDAIIMGYEPMSSFWHIYYNHHEGITPITYTDQEKVDMLLDLGMTMLDGQVFYPGQYLELPETDPFFESTLSFEVTGDHALYFDILTGIFADTDIERHITLEITVTVGSITGTETATLILKPIEVLTIAEFLLLTEETYGIVEGVVVLAIEEIGITIIADDTHTLVVIGLEGTMIGDLILVGGYHTYMDGVIMLGVDKENVFYDIKLHEQENPLTPTPMTPEAFMTSDPESTLLWLNYVEITGSVFMDDMSHMLYITDGVYDVPLLVFDPMYYEVFMSLQGLDISISGFIFPNFDDETSFLMLVFTGDPSDINYGGTDEALVFELGTMLQSYYESLHFYPGQMVDLPTEHPVFPVTITYETDSLLIDLSTMVISDAITEETWIIIEALITLGSYSEIWDIHLHVTPIVPLSISDFLNDTSGMDLFTQGVVIFIIEDEVHQFYIIADANDVLFVMTDVPLNIGDEVIVYGQLYYEDDMPFIMKHDDEAVFEIVNTLVPNPLIPESITIEAFKLLAPKDHMFNYYEVTGVLSHMGEGAFQLKDVDLNAVTIFAPTEAAAMALFELVGYEVVLKGLSITQSEHPGLILVFLNLPDTLSPTLSDEALFTDISQEMISYYNLTIFRQGAYHKLPKYAGYIQASYNILTNASMYDVSSGAILSTILVPTVIQIEVTLTVGTFTDDFIIELQVEPIETTTIDAFLNGLPDTVYQVRGVVVYSKFSFDGGVIILADHTGYMMIPYDLDVKVGQEIIVSGMKTSFMGITTFTEDASLLETVSAFAPRPLSYQPMTIDDILLLDETDPNIWGQAVIVEGYLTHDWMVGFKLVNALGDEIGLALDLYDYEDFMFIHDATHFKVRIYGFLMPNMEDETVIGFMLFPDQLIKVQTLYETDMDMIQAVIDYGTYLYESHEFESRSFIEIIGYVSIFDIHVTYDIISGPEVIDFYMGFINDVPGIIDVTLRMTVYKGDIEVTHDYVLHIRPYTVLNIPNLAMTSIPGVMGGLYIQKMNYTYDYMGGTDFNVELNFPQAESVGAEYFILEYYDVIDGIFKTFMYNDEPLTSLYYDSFQDAYFNTIQFNLELPGNTTYRLRAFNTPESLVSNEVFVGMSYINTAFSDWYHDESMNLTGVMSPEYGFGMEVFTTVYDLEDSIEIEDGVVYSWYRVNPYTFEMMLIEGESSQLYQTRFEDVGYYIMARIEGDGIVADGYLQLLSFDVVKIFNPAKIVSYDRNGFVIEFTHNFDPSTLENMMVLGDYMVDMEILSIIPYGAPRTYRVNVDLSMYDEYYIDMYEGAWFFGLSDQFHNMQGLSIYFGIN